MIDPRSVAVLLDKELRDAWRNRWFLLYSGAFTVLALGISWLGVSGVAKTGFVSLGRTAGSLMNLVILVVPLMGLTLGAQAIAAERERGALLYLLAQPVTPAEVVLAKFLGLTTAVLAALGLGFGVAGMVMSGQTGTGDLADYLGFLGLAALLATSSVALGLLVSAFSSRASLAAGVGLFLWLGLVFLGDMGLMATSIALELGTGELVTAAMVNPLQVFKIAAVLVLRGGLEALGPGGLYAVQRWGEALLPGLVTILVLWTAIPLAVTFWTMGRKRGLS